MILLIGGTSETAPLAAGLAGAGYAVLVSTATGVPLAIGDHPRISRREGRLDEEGMVALGREKGIRAIVDAAHPYAVAVHAAAQKAAQRLGIPCLVFRRDAADIKGDNIRIAADHAEAAAMAFAAGRPVLLTTGSRNLAPYAQAARRTGVPYAARVLDTRESLDACRAAGIRDERIIAGRGPFSIEENLAVIRRFGIGVIVTKESGRVGGVEAKLAAARQTHCEVIVIRRPEAPTFGPVFDDPAALVAALREIGARQDPDPPKGWLLLPAVLGPFACGYFLSYLTRNVNAVIAPDLVREFHLGASDLGLLTSVYFLSFALFQPLLGMLLDRFGPRRVEGSLLLVAAAGALLFAWSGGTSLLIAGRGLIGLGVSACLMAAFQANALWFSRQRLAALNGWVLAAGGIGAVFSTAPVEWVLQWVDWRVLFTVVAAAFAVNSGLIFGLVPERRTAAAHMTIREQFRGFVQIGRNREFWRIAPLAMLSQSVFMSLQGLWAAGWMKDVGGFARGEIAYYLLLAAVGMVTGHMTMGNLASRLERAGIAPSYVVGVGVGGAVLVHATLVFGYSEMQPLIWLLFGFLGTAGTVSFAILTHAFPVSMAGRANTALNLLIFVASFLVQWGIGIVVNLYPADNGNYAPEGYVLAFGATTLLQAASLFWFFRRMRRSV